MMNPLTQIKTIAILPVLITLALVVVAPALATPQSGVTSAPIADGTFDELDVSTKTGRWKARIDTKGASHLYVVQNTVIPGGTFGWHSHPGPSLVIVVSGAATEYEEDDPTCTPHVHPAGSTFVDSGGASGHLVRNEGGVDLVVVVARLVPEGAAQRDNLPNPHPGICPQ
jgi:quercetin dioxygenase-like cupin family protein